jgi:hypothetical protein
MFYWAGTECLKLHVIATDGTQTLTKRLTFPLWQDDARCKYY